MTHTLQKQKKPREMRGSEFVAYEQVENPIVGRILTTYFEYCKHRVAKIGKSGANV